MTQSLKYIVRVAGEFILGPLCAGTIIKNLQIMIGCVFGGTT